MKQKFMNFMRGRYGVDSLTNFLVGVSFAAIFLNLFFRNNLIYLVGMVCLVYAYFRMFSRNYSKRYNENQWFLNKTSKVRGIMYKEKNRMRLRKTHHIYSCPQCRQKIKIPRGKGKIEITCPKCRNTFVKKS